MNVNEMTFGIEIECYLPVGVIPANQIGGYHSGRQIAALPVGWNAQRDGSLHRAPAGYVAVEIVSPVLSGEAGMAQVKLVCEWLNANHARVDRCCGFHVHVGVERGNTELLRKIACLTAKHEKALYAVTGSHDRECSVYCGTVQNNGDYQRAALNGSLRDVSHARYHVLNLTNVLGGGKPTVEFRVFSGTTNAVKTVSYVRMCLAIVEKAADMKKLPKWDAAQAKETSNLHHKGGKGQSEMLRFFYYLGWTKGKVAKCYGNLQAAGVATLEESKKELMRLAAKYDSRS